MSKHITRNDQFNHNVFAMRVVEEHTRRFLQKIPILWHKHIFVCIDACFAIHAIHPKSLIDWSNSKRCIKMIGLKLILTSNHYTELINRSI